MRKILPIIGRFGERREQYMNWKSPYRTAKEISTQMSEHNEIFDSLITNPEIRLVSENSFKAHSFRTAVFDSYVKLEEMIKEKTNFPKDNKGRELIGVGLMHKVFDVKNPLLLWNPLRTQAERDEIEGFKYIFAGAMLGIKNPISHQVEYQDPWRALNHIILANYLAYLVDLGESKSPVNVETKKTSEILVDKSAKNEKELSNVRDSILADLENNRVNLLGLFRSGGVDYLDHLFTLTTWNHYKNKFESYFPSIFGDVLEVYSNLETLNEVIKMSVGTVDYSVPRFKPHKLLALKTEEKIRGLGAKKFQSRFDGEEETCRK